MANSCEHNERRTGNLSVFICPHGVCILIDSEKNMIYIKIHHMMSFKKEACP